MNSIQKREQKVKDKFAAVFGGRMGEKTHGGKKKGPGCFLEERQAGLFE